MAAEIVRIYKGKDAEMLTVCATIVTNATVPASTKTFLLGKRANWADPFFPDLTTRINNAFQNYLGVDNAKEMREATIVVKSVQAQALPMLAEFKVQIAVDFTNPRRTEILTQLGFTEHHKAAQRKDQEALVELLYKFKQNMTTALKGEITAAGMAEDTITAIVGFADTFKNSNVSQEALKGGRKVISAAGVAEFNAIYSQVIGVAKIAAKFYKDDAAMKDKFSYSKLLKALNFQPPPPPVTP